MAKAPIQASCDAIDVLHPVDAVIALGNLGRIAAVPWKNEGGQTRELCVEPAGADFSSFVWRASVADVGRDGGFSTFEGIARTIILLEGGGFTMHAADGALVHDLIDCFAPYAFPGEMPISVRLHGAPTLDFNLMIRRELADGEVVVMGSEEVYRLAADTVLLYVAQGAATLSAAAGWRHALHTGEFAQLRPGTAMPDLLCAAGAVVLAIRIRPRQ